MSIDEDFTGRSEEFIGPCGLYFRNDFSDGNMSLWGRDFDQSDWLFTYFSKPDGPDTPSEALMFTPTDRFDLGSGVPFFPY